MFRIGPASHWGSLAVGGAWDQREGYGSGPFVHLVGGFESSGTRRARGELLFSGRGLTVSSLGELILLDGRVRLQGSNRAATRNYSGIGSGRQRTFGQLETTASARARPFGPWHLGVGTSLVDKVTDGHRVDGSVYAESDLVFERARLYLRPALVFTDPDSAGAEALQGRAQLLTGGISARPGRTLSLNMNAAWSRYTDGGAQLSGGFLALIDPMRELRIGLGISGRAGSTRAWIDEQNTVTTALFASFSPGPVSGTIGVNLSRFEDPVAVRYRVEAAGNVHANIAGRVELGLRATAVADPSEQQEPDLRIEVVARARLDSEVVRRASSALGRGDVTGAVFVDYDEDGRRDDGEPGVAGIPVSLGDQVTETDADGQFAFLRSRAGIKDLIVQESAVGQDVRWTGPARRRVAVRPGETSGYMIGVSYGSRIFGRVYNDRSGRGDPSEINPGVGNAAVLIRGPEGEEWQRRTDDAGNFYLGPVPPGEYSVEVPLRSLPQSMVPAEETVKTVTVGSGDSDRVFFGMRALRSISGTVLQDVNENGRRDDGDRPLAGVRIYIDGQQAVTDSRGRFLLRNLPGGRLDLVIDVGTLPADLRDVAVYEHPVELSDAPVQLRNVVLLVPDPGKNPFEGVVP